MFKPSIDEFNKIELYKKSKGEVAKMAAFSLLSSPSLYIKAPRRLGITEIYINIFSDFENKSYTFKLELIETGLGIDSFFLEDVFYNLAKEIGYGLFYYYFEFRLGDLGTYYTNSINNVDYSFSENKESLRAFRMIIYKEDFTTPNWAKKTVMYQIFVDRFNKGSRLVEKKEDSVIIDNWDSCPEFNEKVGDPLKNNTFFGGTLYGVVEKLDYLSDLGVGCIYLNPIFDAYSNHKYDTGDYEEIDQMFGGKDAFDLLIREAKKRNIHIILDGVFNHTGDDSKYFNRYGKYNLVGAYQSKSSPYYNWYSFIDYPDDYESWWGIKILPKLNNRNSETREYFLGENGIIKKWLNEGAYGFRLDVADELPQGFLSELRARVKAENPNALIVGEVWENAADKIAYGERRRYFLGNELDSVMNYPIKNSIIDIIKTGDSENFYNTVMDIYSSYPPQCANVLMNILGTHDTERILTVLGGESGIGRSNLELSTLFMSEEARGYGIRLLKLASIIQFTLPGIPTIYYGDEAGLEGYHDPFCRRAYPWGREDLDLVSHYKRLSAIKNNYKPLHIGILDFKRHSDGIIEYDRVSGKDIIKVIVNASNALREIAIEGEYLELLTDSIYRDKVRLEPKSGVILKGID